MDDVLGVGIACAKAAREPVTATLNDCLGIGGHLELAGFSGCEHDIQIEALLDEGCETRSLGLVVLSGRAVLNLDIHLGSISNLAQVE